MKVLFLIGDAAVGKMTVGQEVMKQTGLRLFHNHITIEPVIEVFGEYNGCAINRIREVYFEEFAKTELPGMIFTYMWAFDHKSDWDYIAHVRDIFTKEKPDTEFFYAELVAPQEVRLKRNATENRLTHKASKRDIEMSNQRLLDADKHYHCVSLDGEIPFENYIKLDNSELSPEEAARAICERFGW